MCALAVFFGMKVLVVPSLMRTFFILSFEDITKTGTIQLALYTNIYKDNCLINSIVHIHFWKYTPKMNMLIYKKIPQSKTIFS